MHTNPPVVVLDTNVALDWLLFADPRSASLAAALGAGRARWLACPRMRDEFRHVLARGLAVRHGANEAVVLASWDRHATLIDAPPSQTLRCRDPDDQVFLDLALAAGARWLLSRDRALLALARRAASQGLRIAPPERWGDEV